MDYAELHCLTNFTFLRGASHAQELVETAVRRGYKALAITDECSLAGVVRAHVAAREYKDKFKLIVGAEFRLEDGLRFVLIAQDRAGYGNLSELITRARRNAGKGEYRLCRDHLDRVGKFCWPPCRQGAEPQIEEALWLAQRFTGR